MYFVSHSSSARNRREPGTAPSARACACDEARITTWPDGVDRLAAAELPPDVVTVPTATMLAPSIATRAPG